MLLVMIEILHGMVMVMEYGEVMGWGEEVRWWLDVMELVRCDGGEVMMDYV